MMKITKSILFFLLAISLLVIGGVSNSRALAQDVNEATGFGDVTLWIYPEYDDPRLLVMLQGQIAGTIPPAEVRFLVPSAAEMYSAGSIDAQGRYTGGPPNRIASSIAGWDEISYQVTTDTFRVEYYDPIIIGYPNKAISYEFRWLYPISSLQVVVQEPLRASNFNVVPSGQSVVDSEGFNVYLYNYSGLDDESPLYWNVTYTRSETTPSLLLDDGGISKPIIIAIAVIVLAALIGGGFFWIWKSRPKTRAARRQSVRSTAVRRTRRNRP